MNVTAIRCRDGRNRRSNRRRGGIAEFRSWSGLLWCWGCTSWCDPIKGTLFLPPSAIRASVAFYSCFLQRVRHSQRNKQQSSTDRSIASSLSLPTRIAAMILFSFRVSHIANRRGKKNLCTDLVRNQDSYQDNPGSAGFKLTWFSWFQQGLHYLFLAGYLANDCTLKGWLLLHADVAGGSPIPESRADIDLLPGSWMELIGCILEELEYIFTN